MANPPNIFKSLLSLQDKHQTLFALTNSTVVDYLLITWSPEVKVIIKGNVPDVLLIDFKEELQYFLI